MESRGRQLTRAEVVEIFCVSETTVDAWRRRGLKFHLEGRRKVVYSGDVVAFIFEDAAKRAIPPAETKGDGRLELEIRERQAKVAIAELELSKRRRETVAVADAADFVAKRFAVVRTRMLAVPSKIAPLVITARSQPEAHAIASSAVEEALSELTVPRDAIGRELAGGPGGARGGARRDPGGDAPAAAAPHREPVGRPVPRAQPRGRRGSRTVVDRAG